MPKRQKTSKKTKNKEYVKKPIGGKYINKNAKKENITRKSSSGATTNKDISNLSMRLFGVPYQFTDIVDPRVSGISSEIGKNFTENILMEAPVCTIIPGNPAFLPGNSKERKMSTAQALLGANDVTGVSSIVGDIDDKDMKLYDFQPAYDEYMNYVNLLCMTGATFLELGDDTSDMVGGTRRVSSSFEGFDWRQYRWNNKANSSYLDRFKQFRLSLDDVDDTITNKETLTSISKSYKYIQFYIDSDVSPDESLSNSTGASSFKGLFDQGSTMFKEVAFMANSGGIDANTLHQFTEGVTSGFQAGVGAILGNNGISSSLSRIINLGGETLKGNNLVIPDIYQSSDYSKNYSFTVHLKSPYGTRFGYYYDIFVPLMHLMALVMPRQQSANSFNSPFLVKMYVNNTFTCNLGMATSISVQKVSDSYSTSGLPSEVDVTVQVADLYSDLMMTPVNKPKMFIENTSLVEYIASMCGLDLTAPNMALKWKKNLNTYINAIKSIKPNVGGMIEEKAFGEIRKFFGMTSY